MKIVIQFILTAALLFPALSPAQEESAAPPAATEPKTWTFNAGIGSPKAWNYVGVTREYLLDDHTAFFVTAGLGTALVGAGLVYYGNREGNGIAVSSAIGIVDLQATLAYQLKVGPQDFVAMGASYGAFFMQCTCWLPVLSYEHRY
ncbi:MAG: hypothetical protein A3H31_07205 [Gallionellales bacterium RIFCSPLOWO2_02_FULL_57_47]|nr:MAG: hypothetical protein A3H31_07205 [Gallionellales bacterium RIFCSPLOWO2_02_FULL_57_47]